MFRVLGIYNFDCELQKAWTLHQKCKISSNIIFFYKRACTGAIRILKNRTRACDVRACGQKIRRNSQFEFEMYILKGLTPLCEDWLLCKFSVWQKGKLYDVVQSYIS